MVVLQFAWGGGPTNVHLPHNHYDNCFVYPGTHDNETTVGWFKGSASATDKAYLMTYLKVINKPGGAERGRGVADYGMRCGWEKR